MAGRPGFLGGPRQGGPEWSDEPRGSEPFGGFRFRDAPRTDAYGRPVGFDPVWGTLGGPTAQTIDPWANDGEETLEGAEAEVEVFGTGFQISGKIRTGGFDRLSDWLNVQTGFVQVRDATHVFLGHEETPANERSRGSLWVRLDQIVLVAQRNLLQQGRPGAPVVQKQRRRVAIVTPGYKLQGSLHIHADGSMKQFLETPEPRFIPVTELIVRWLDNPRLVARYPFAAINREQLITLLDETDRPADAGAESGDASGSGDPVLQRWGAA